MLEVPGITRETLETMRPQAVAALRWGLFARVLEPVATADFDEVEQQLADEETLPSKPTLAGRRGRARERIAQAKLARAEARTLLMLDEEVE